MPELITPEFRTTPDGLCVWMEENDQRIPVSEWTSHTGTAHYAGAFLRLRDDGEAVEQEDGKVLRLSWSSVANLPVEDLKYMGLPNACPYTLEITADGALHDRYFELHYGFIQKGRRILGHKREGAWLRAGGDDFILIDPLYDIVEAIDTSNSADSQDIESRMLRWGQISQNLPDGSEIPGQLRSIRITVATGFELHPFLNESEEPDFDPVIGRWQTSVNESGEEEREFRHALPTARQTEFSKKFRGLSKVKHRYSAGGAYYIVLTPQVKSALVAVHRAQRASLEERHEFLKNPSGFLRGALDDAGETGVDVDRVFCDDELSARVEGVGIWSRRILPWIQRASDPWLPPERLGLRIGTKVVQIPVEELPILLDQVNAAITGGAATVATSDGIEIPASVSTASAIEELIRQIPPVQSPKDRARSDSKKQEVKPDQVLLITENLESLQFRREPRKCTPGVSELTPAIRSTLLPHQQEAVTWLLNHWEAGSWGALLADDMGLGKTLESLAFLSCLQTHLLNLGTRYQPILVVAPTGLLQNWLDEHNKHLSGNGLGRALEAYGTGLKKLKIPNSSAGNELGADMPLPKLDTDKLKRAAWVLTTYETLRDYQHSFGRVRWSAGVFDEAQKIKNPGTQITVAALAMNIDFALLMTGTPVENRPADIWSLLDRIEPGEFGTLKEFSKKYESNTPDHNAALTKLNHALTAGNGTPQLMLRRLKEDHLSGLPQKSIHPLIVDMPKPQADEYDRVLNRPPTDEPILQKLARLRSISLHPEVPGDLTDDQYIQRSARLKETFSILQNIARCQEKALIFVESRQMQGFLIGAIRRCFELPDDVLVINGAVPGKTRKKRVDLFQNRRGFDVMLLSPRAGGVGLTLTAANHVIHLSRWWNPAVEDQCTDRVFRIGQQRPVHVYFPMAKHPRYGKYSFDLKLNDLITRKREMNQSILSPTTASKGDLEELYRSMTRTETDHPASAEHLNVDLLEPEEFENWVLKQLSLAGYETRRTPRSGDCGADGLAYSRGNTEEHTLLIQCKRMQPDAKCNSKAVQEVLRAAAEYEIQGEPKFMVVTTADDFTTSAKTLALREGVKLVSRTNLSRLRTWQP